MIELSGIPASPGIAVAPAFLFADEDGRSVPVRSIRSADVADTVVTVARWFGGIKLGTGGLARAYHEAAAAALAAAPRRRVTPGAEGGVAFPYAWQGTLARLLARHEGRVVSEQYGETAVWRVWLPLGAWSAFAAEARDATAGAAKIEAPV